ncbi:MAG TPA: NUDIX hydrolase [Bacteroidales bacterium]|nr:NUDIX hydrolase [Bacteroidales bacterium]
MPFTYEYPMPAVTVDAVIFRKTEGSSEVLLIRRLNEPFKGQWAIPGGFINIDEELDDAVVRELQEETGISHHTLKQLFTVGTVGRDPRYRTISVIYFGWFDETTMRVKAGDDAADAAWFNLKELPSLAFDHRDVLRKVLEILKKTNHVF